MTQSGSKGNVPKSTKRRRNILILLVIGTASLLIRLLMSYEFDRTALLYVGIPFLVALALLFVVEKPEKPSLHRYYGHIVMWSLIVMLGTSIVLFEGFICVLMFMPIYFAIILLMYLFQLLGQYLNHVDKSKHYGLFPMPTRIDAETLVAGDKHTIDFIYHRWFVTNTHKGNMTLEISEVQPEYIRTTFLEDTSYIGNYLRLKGTEIKFTPALEGGTKVSLTIHYHRFLDPAWYFGPLQEYAIGQTASLLLNELFIPKEVFQSPGDNHVF